MSRAQYLAGTWYPRDAKGCLRAIAEYLGDTQSPAGDWRGLIAPHAGWTYSGRAAARAYQGLASVRKAADLVVLFGSHRGALGPNTVFCGDGWDTPLGVIKTAAPLAGRIAKELALQEEDVTPAQPDNAVEVQLPFVRHFFPRAHLLMLGVEPTQKSVDIGRAVGALVKEAARDAVFIGSTDLTHYGPQFDFTPAGEGEAAARWVRSDNDQGFIAAVLAADAEAALRHALTHQSACSPGAVAATLAALAAYGAPITARLVEHYLSYDVEQDVSFVGYAGMVL